MVRFKRGSSMSDGVIVGPYPAFTPLHTQDPGRLLRDVVNVLETHHGLRLEIGADSIHTLRRQERGKPQESTAAGVIICVYMGAASVYVDGRRHDVDYGWWVYIPPGKEYHVSSTVIEGANLQHATATVIAR